MMQTRRKSLNLGDLGVIAPKRARGISHPSPPDTVIEVDERPPKKPRQSHDLGSSPSRQPSNTPRKSTTRETKSHPIISELSPPPSPLHESIHRIDTEGINDDIVIGTIRQLEETGNRPHLVRELAAVLERTHASVEKSANQTALISSRLTAYLQRQWPAISPCPLAKEVAAVHPRRLYYFLTTAPRQPIPPYVDVPPSAKSVAPPPLRIITPSLSSASESHSVDDENEARYLRERQAMSPSPEIDLSSVEFDGADGPPSLGSLLLDGCSFSSSERNSVPRDRPSYTAQRRSSPPLEREERDFKQTATALLEQAQEARRRSSSSRGNEDVQVGSGGDAATAAADRQHQPLLPSGHDVALLSTEPADSESHASAELFLNLRIVSPSDHQPMEFSSPLMKPMSDRTIATTAAEANGDAATAAAQDHAMSSDSSISSEADSTSTPPEDQLDIMFSIDDLQCPEDIELDELEDLFAAY